MISVKKAVTSLIPPRLRPRTIARRRLERATRGRIVLSGPFAGMKYVNQSVGSMWFPKVLGTYELELASIIRGFCLARPPSVVDIGAAEGYYAVGVAQPEDASDCFRSGGKGPRAVEEACRIEWRFCPSPSRGFMRPRRLEYRFGQGEQRIHHLRYRGRGMRPA